MTYLDTHALIWLYMGDAEKLGPAARKAADADELIVPAAAILELEFLHEIGRLKPTALTVLSALKSDIGLRECDLPGSTIATYAIEEKWTRDPFDRLIVANARAADAPLITKDERIHNHYRHVIW